MRCFKSSKGDLYGICVLHQCQSDLDCCPWMSCREGTCIYEKCSKSNPCKPGQVCAEGYCFLPKCSSSFHCPKGFECTAGKCKKQDQSCIDSSDCANDEMCNGIIC